MSAVDNPRYQDVLVNTVGGKGLSPATGFVGWVGGIVRATSGLLAKRQRQRQTLNELSNLDDRLLRDIGIDPADLPARVAVGELREIAELLAQPRR